MPPKKKEPAKKKPKKVEKNPLGQPYPSYPPATQGRQGDWMDKILREQYDWWK